MEGCRRNYLRLSTSEQASSLEQWRSAIEAAFGITDADAQTRFYDAIQKISATAIRHEFQEARVAFGDPDALDKLRRHGLRALEDEGE